MLVKNYFVSSVISESLEVMLPYSIWVSVCTTSLTTVYYYIKEGHGCVTASQWGSPMEKWDFCHALVIYTNCHIIWTVIDSKLNILRLDILKINLFSWNLSVYVHIYMYGFEGVHMVNVIHIFDMISVILFVCVDDS